MSSPSRINGQNDPYDPYDPNRRLLTSSANQNHSSVYPSSPLSSSPNQTGDPSYMYGINNNDTFNSPNGGSPATSAPSSPSIRKRSGKKKQTVHAVARRQASMLLLHDAGTFVTLYKRRWLVMLLFASQLFLVSYLQFTFASIADVVQDFYGLQSSFWLNFQVTVYMMCSPLNVLASVVVNRWGLRGCVLIGCSFNILGAFVRLAGLRSDLFWLMTVGQGCCALAQPFFLTCFTLLPAQWFGEDERTIATTIMVVLNILGQAAVMAADAFVKGPVGIQWTLISEAIMVVSTGIVTMLVVKEHPPTPPSSSAAAKIVSATQHFDDEPGPRRTANFDTSVAPISTDGAPLLNKKGAIVDDGKSLAAAASENTTGDPFGHGNDDVNPIGAFWRDFKFCVTDWNFVVLTVAYTCGFASFSSLSTLINQYCVPYGYTDFIISMFGVTMIVSGTIGCIVVGVVADITKQYRLMCSLCLVLATASCICITFALKEDNSLQLFLTMGAAGFFGMSTVPTAYQLGVEVTFPVKESVSTGIMNLVALIVSSIFILGLGKLQQTTPPYYMGTADHPKLAIYIGTGVLLFATVMFIAFFRGRYKRTEFETEAKARKEQMRDEEAGIEGQLGGETASLLIRESF